MMNKACFVLILAMSPVTLFAGETMVTPTTPPPTGCHFRVDKCETSVATDPSYLHYKDGTTTPSQIDVTATNGDPTLYRSDFAFADYAAPQKETVEDLIALIRSKLSNCPEVTVCYDNDTGIITVHYLKTTCDCDCDWTINVRNVTADSIVWKRTSDNYSDQLGQMERRKFHTANEQDAQAITSACAQICTLNTWTMFK